MYAVIRTGGKQYRVAPGDVLKIEKSVADTESTIEFSEVLAFSGEAGSVVKPASAKVVASVVREGRGDKILTAEEAAKKLMGHRQALTEVRIEIG
jgi:large subunit ribosomal protein L21